MSERPWKWNRCVFIEGIGRVHALGPPDSIDGGVAAMDAVGLADQIWLSCMASDVLSGQAPGKVLWAVRFKEHEA